MGDFLMPSLGADMEAGTLVEWRKKPGDRVARGDIIAEVETEKGIIEVEVFTSGVIERLLVEPETKVPVGTPLAVIREDGEQAAPTASEAAVVVPKQEPAAGASERSVGVPAPQKPAPASLAPSISASPSREAPKISPVARRRASELGLDPTALAGTGPGGAVTLEDVERAVAQRAPRGSPLAPEPSASRTSTVPPAAAALSEDARSRARRAIAAAMTRSKREIPHYYVNHSVDVTSLLAWIEDFNANAAISDRIIPGVAFLKAVALAIRDFPGFNGFWIDGRAIPSPSIHVGAAIALRGGGLVAPAIRDTDKMTLPELMNAFRDLVARARSGSLRSSEMSDPTITVTSLGDRGTESVTGVIYPPQLAIVGFGRIVERPWVVSGAVAPRSIVHISLAADHRATDGHEGALFLARIAERLESPETL